MATEFRLEIAAPKTNVSNSFTKTFTAESNVVSRVEISFKKEKGRISTLTADLWDPGLKILDELPDPEFFDIPVRLYMAPPGQPQSLTVLAWQGIITALPFSWPTGNLQIVSHDASYKSRTRAFCRTFTNRSSVELTKAIAKNYGLEIDTSTLNATFLGSLKQRKISVGVPATGEKFFSDWDHVVRELASDGLVPVIKGNKLTIQKFPTKPYPVTFRPGDGYVIRVEGRIMHVKGAGGQGNVSTPISFDHKGAEKALKGTDATTADKAKGGDGHTHRKPIGGPATASKGAHTEDNDGTKWARQSDRMKGRKDELSITLNPVPDLELTHLVNLDGFASKVNGTWEPIEIRHVVVPNESGSSTTVTLARGTGKQAAAQSGAIAFDFAKANT